MSSSPRGFKFWMNAWLPVAVGIGVILMESTVWFGSNHTSGPLRWLWETLFGPVTNARWGGIHHLIRKSGHFFGYGAIGLAWLRAWWMTLPRSSFLPDAFLALLGTALVASCDGLLRRHRAAVRGLYLYASEDAQTAGAGGVMIQGFPTPIPLEVSIAIALSGFILGRIFRIVL